MSNVNWRIVVTLALTSTDDLKAPRNRIELDDGCCVARVLPAKLAFAEVVLIAKAGSSDALHPCLAFRRSASSSRCFLSLKRSMSEPA